MVGLETYSKDLEFENFDGLVHIPFFLSHRSSSSKISILFSQSIDFSVSCLEKEVYGDDCWKGG